MKRLHLATCLLVAGPGGLALGQPAPAQPDPVLQPPPTGSAPGPGDTAPPAGSAPTGIPKGALGPEYVDGSFGIGLRPIAGATIDRRKRHVEGRLQLAQFVRFEVAWSMALRLWPSRRPLDPPTARQTLGSELILQYPDAEVTRSDPTTVDAREAIRLEASFSAEGQRWIRHQLVVRMKPTDYVLVVLIVPADDAEAGAKAFGEIVASFRVLRTETQQQQIDAALERGVALKGRLAEGRKLSASDAPEPVSLRLSRDGQPVGVVQIREKSAKIEGKEGVRSLQEAWIFSPDTSVQFLSEERFIAADLSYDEWRSLSQLMPGKQVDPRQRVVVHMEAGIRRGDNLIVKYAGTAVDEKQDKIIEVEPSYAPGSWPMLLPRLVDLKTPELYAFSMYDTERRGMILRTFRVTGPTQVNVSGRRVSGYRIEDCEGLLPPVNELAVDESGRILFLSAGPLEMEAATEKQLDAEFGERIKATQKQFRENAGLPEPSAQPNAAPKPAPAAKPANPKPPPRAPSRDRQRSRR